MELRKLAMARVCENLVIDGVRHMGLTVTSQDVVEYLN